VERVGAFFADGLRAVAAKYPAIGEVRAEGLMAAIELARPELTGKVVAALAREGVLAYPGGVQDNVICFTPPLRITEEQLRFSIEALERSLGEATRREN
jgi:4-aminobutyrate aminotransferase-like enzyme